MVRTAWRAVSAALGIGRKRSPATPKTPSESGPRFVADAMAADDWSVPANAFVRPVTGIDGFQNTSAGREENGATGGWLYSPSRETTRLMRLAGPA